MQSQVQTLFSRHDIEDQWFLPAASIKRAISELAIKPAMILGKTDLYLLPDVERIVAVCRREEESKSKR